MVMRNLGRGTPDDEQWHEDEEKVGDVGAQGSALIEFPINELENVGVRGDRSRR